MIASDSDLPAALTHEQRETLAAIAAIGSHGSFDQQAMGDLFALGLVEVQSADRRVVLTERGRQAFAAIQAAAPLYDVVVDLGDGKYATLESGLSIEMARAALAKAAELFQNVQIIKRASCPPSKDSKPPADPG